MPPNAMPPKASPNVSATVLGSPLNMREKASRPQRVVKTVQYSSSVDAEIQWERRHLLGWCIADYIRDLELDAIAELTGAQFDGEFRVTGGEYS
jgi:hypothetical protein